ncbi:MAG: response regulator [Lentisphaeria bacterium]|nr:response regulator [Lentisphaeria bacterium]
MTNLIQGEQDNLRILIVDDTKSIHEDFEKILQNEIQVENQQLNDLLDDFLDEPDHPNLISDNPNYEIHHAYQGQEAIDLVEKAESSGAPYALIYMDVRMPPGIDGIQAIRQIWEKYPHNEFVLCTAFSDYSWEEMLQVVGVSDQLQFVRKPFDVVTIKQMTLSITRKWNLAAKNRHYLQHLEALVELRTSELRNKVTELEKALDEVQQLQSIIPMCAWCNKVRNDDNFWQKVDDYLKSHTTSEITHGICPECYDKVLTGEGIDPTNQG